MRNSTFKKKFNPRNKKKKTFLNEEISLCQKRIWQREVAYPESPEETFLALLTIFPAITKGKSLKNRREINNGV